MTKEEYKEEAAKELMGSDGFILITSRMDGEKLLSTRKISMNPITASFLLLKAIDGVLTTPSTVEEDTKIDITE